ncbi:zinc finger protein 37-like [Dunckerocampus dactyliophorus]|uniref:zinc finger protein 37-like n=1 Tax=Dunckerocampus dactyliophorus TaxID=161453 RepID=UPI0024075959|nr:zinc finger protein 37-like [Dunckerocampus dactyliophorus]
MVQTCCVINCHNLSRDRFGNKKDGGRFFSFPTWKQSQGAVICELTKRRRMAWIAAVRRPNITFNAITRHMLVCSRHFHTGRPANEMDESHPDWAPSLHLGHTEVKAADNERLQITLHEEELSPTREENERLRQQLEDVCKTQVVLHVEDIQQLEQGEPQPPDIKEEEEEPEAGYIKAEEEEQQPPYVKEEELLITQKGEDPLARLLLTGVSVKTEAHEDKPLESSQLHHSPSEEKREAEPSSSSSTQHMTTEADGDHCGGSQADNLLAPLSDSDDITSHSAEEDSDDSREPLSNKQSECSKKKTAQRFNCSVCDKRFSFKSNLTRHMRTHTGERPFHCSDCGKSFNEKVALVIHMRTHTGEKPFTCSDCGKSFTRKKVMERHMTVHTGERPFSCSDCGKSFGERIAMVIHMRTHTGERPFSCSYCGKRFTQKSDMQSHVRIHTGEKPFTCSACFKRFSRKVNLVSHTRTHTGEKPFSCSNCGDTFCWKSSLKRHMQKH